MPVPRQRGFHGQTYRVRGMSGRNRTFRYPVCRSPFLRTFGVAKNVPEDDVIFWVPGTAWTVRNTLVPNGSQRRAKTPANHAEKNPRLPGKEGRCNL